MRPSPSHVEIEVVVHGKTETLREQVPQGFPPKLIPTLADFMRRGFEAARTHFGEKMPSLAGLALEPDPRGRRRDAQVERVGREAFKLREQGLTYGQIAPRVCPKRRPGHSCGKACIDRVRQAHLSYRARKEWSDYLRELKRAHE